MTGALQSLLLGAALLKQPFEGRERASVGRIQPPAHVSWPNVEIGIPFAECMDSVTVTAWESFVNPLKLRLNKMPNLFLSLTRGYLKGMRISEYRQR